MRDREEGAGGGESAHRAGGFGSAGELTGMLGGSRMEAVGVGAWGEA